MINSHRSNGQLAMDAMLLPCCLPELNNHMFYLFYYEEG